MEAVDRIPIRAVVTYATGLAQRATIPLAILNMAANTSEKIVAYAGVACLRWSSEHVEVVA